MYYEYLGEDEVFIAVEVKCQVPMSTSLVNEHPYLVSVGVLVVSQPLCDM